MPGRITRGRLRSLRIGKFHRDGRDEKVGEPNFGERKEKPAPGGRLGRMFLF